MLNPAMRYELDTQVARIERYRALAADLANRVPGIVPLKGLEVAGLYPAGLTRFMNDLDYTVADERRLWRLVGELVGDGWDLHTATFVRVGERVHVLVCMRMPHEDPYSLPYGVEVTSYVALGDLAGVAPVVRLPARWRDPAVKNLLMLLFERFEQPYRARDLVDAALLLAAVADFAALRHEIDRLRLWPEYAELEVLLGRAGLITGRTHPRSTVAAVAGSRARRAGRRLAGLRSPAGAAARHLQRRLVLGNQSRSERLLWAAAGRRMNADRALRAGLLCFGLPVPGVRPAVEAATVRRSDGLVFVDTPVARFLLTAGEDVEEQDVERLAADADANADADAVADANADAAAAPAPAEPAAHRPMDAGAPVP